jgi:hypothetical protein
MTGINTHVLVIFDTSPVKEGNGKELDVQQHLRAHRLKGYEPSGPFITSFL